MSADHPPEDSNITQKDVAKLVNDIVSSGRMDDYEKKSAPREEVTTTDLKANDSQQIQPYKGKPPAFLNRKGRREFAALGRKVKRGSNFTKPKKKRRK